MNEHLKEANELLNVHVPDDLGANFQKKIEIEQEEFPNDIISSKPKVTKKKMDLVVVASLLNKIPNFAHLTRTGEIFDVD
eukprot:CAMPEP_0114578122 /NCGR_PEP_ID=MMETSP0125-20121206/2705_1 /TAXON_ID=485358 ORGANISM="Aristerostoma sp., Strain ATCC 50986" /NCGR_SAMPLE_ID=MMETSP0125 /ASSEMBLY_ACC=CAM_ASM_000245 /LENGTH=79 /DNA_ID=CAMNT_0001767963 /DNA_START=452 /DNA_END=691 /DNA_ORIENTATION=-